MVMIGLKLKIWPLVHFYMLQYRLKVQGPETLDHLSSLGLVFYTSTTIVLPFTIYGIVFICY